MSVVTIVIVIVIVAVIVIVIVKPEDWQKVTEPLQHQGGQDGGKLLTNDDGNYGDDDDYDHDGDFNDDYDDDEDWEQHLYENDEPPKVAEAKV